MSIWKQLTPIALSPDGRHITATYRSTDYLNVTLHIARDDADWGIYQVGIVRERKDPTAAESIRTIPLEWLKNRAVNEALDQRLACG